MTNTTLPAGAGSAPKSLVARFFGVITSPRATYESIVAHPKWFGMLLLAVLCAAVLVGGFLMTQVGQDAWFAQMQERATGDRAAQQLQAFEKMLPYVGYVTAGSMVVFVPVMYLVVSGILFVLFNATMGGDATFKKVFTVAVHSAPVGILGQLFTIPMNYARGTMTSATNLAVLLPMFDESSFIAKFLGAIDLFLVWQLFVLAIGLAVLYRRRTQPIAITLLGLYVVIALIIAAVKAGS
jgi:Yip1-like protein